MRAASLLLSLAIAACSKAASVTFTNTKRLLFDVDGNQIDAYGSKINLFDGKYYLYGNSFSTTGEAYGIKSYSSVDLEHWNYEGFIFNPNGTNPCNASGGCGRPHILYNDLTSQYVLWVNAGASGYPVATSTRPTGPFTFLNGTATLDPQFDGFQPADFTVEKFGSKAYLVFSALNFEDPRAGSLWPPIFQTLHISELSPLFTNTTQRSYPVTSNMTDFIDQETESPDLFMRKGIYYVAASNTCGYCNGSIGLVYRSESLQGPWERQIIAGNSCQGQVEGVLPLGDGSFVWHSTSVPGSPRVGFGGHIFQPLEFNEDGSVKDLDCSPDAEFKVDFERGKGAVASGAATEAGQATPLDADYTAVCDSDSFDLIQTWTAAQSGVVTNVSVNIAASGIQVVPLNITVFKFSSYEDLISPTYKWETLGTAGYTVTDLTYVFDTVDVPLATKTTVSKGDKLGVYITGYDIAPYCHLEFDSTGCEDKGYKLFQRGYGQNSWRGIKGKTSIIYERIGKGIKFFVTYA